jgi:DegV family protein with EDD domain
MIIITNPGSNLSPRALARYKIVLTPQRIMVGGEEHTTLEHIPLAEVDRWVQSSKEHPYTIGTTAAEATNTFLKVMADGHEEMLCIMTSRKIVGSYTSACSAAKTLRQRHPQLRISVIDTKITDMGAGMCAALAGEAMLAGLSMDRIVPLMEAAAEHGRNAFVLSTLDYLVRGGRASFLRAWLARVMEVTPLLAFQDGEISLVDKVSTRVDTAPALVDNLKKQLGNSRRPVWCCIAHGEVPDRANRLAELLRAQFDVKHLVIRPFQTTIYLNAGPGALAAFLLPLDALPWAPTTAPAL